MKEFTAAHPISNVDVESRLKAVKSNKAPGPDLLPTCIRPVLEYACQVWNFNSPDYLKEETERIQKIALRIICLNLS